MVLSATDMPITDAVPVLGFINPKKVLRVVDLPAPFPPRRANTSPLPTSKLRLSRIVRWPIRTDNSLALITDFDVIDLRYKVESW